MAALREVPAVELHEVDGPDDPALRHMGRMAEAIDPVHEAARSAGDVLLVYFAGHGLLHGRAAELHLTVATTDRERGWTSVPTAATSPPAAGRTPGRC